MSTTGGWEENWQWRFLGEELNIRNSREKYNEEEEDKVERRKKRLMMIGDLGGCGGGGSRDTKSFFDGNKNEYSTSISSSLMDHHLSPISSSSITKDYQTSRKCNRCCDDGGFGNGGGGGGSAIIFNLKRDIERLRQDKMNSDLQIFEAREALKHQSYQQANAGLINRSLHTKNRKLQIEMDQVKDLLEEREGVIRQLRQEVILLKSYPYRIETSLLEVPHQSISTVEKSKVADLYEENVRLKKKLAELITLQKISNQRNLDLEETLRVFIDGGGFSPAHTAASSMITNRSSSRSPEKYLDGDDSSPSVSPRTTAAPISSAPSYPSYPEINTSPPVITINRISTLPPSFSSSSAERRDVSSSPQKSQFIRNFLPPRLSPRALLQATSSPSMMTTVIPTTSGAVDSSLPFSPISPPPSPPPSLPSDVNCCSGSGGSSSANSSLSASCVDEVAPVSRTTISFPTSSSSSSSSSSTLTTTIQVSSPPSHDILISRDFSSRPHFSSNYNRTFLSSPTQVSSTTGREGLLSSTSRRPSCSSSALSLMSSSHAQKQQEQPLSSISSVESGGDVAPKTNGMLDNWQFCVGENVNSDVQEIKAEEGERGLKKPQPISSSSSVPTTNTTTTTEQNPLNEDVLSSSSLAVFPSSVAEMPYPLYYQQPSASSITTPPLVSYMPYPFHSYLDDDCMVNEQTENGVRGEENSSCSSSLGLPSISHFSYDDPGFLSTTTKDERNPKESEKNSSSSSSKKKNDFDKRKNTSERNEEAPLPPPASSTSPSLMTFPSSDEEASRSLTPTISCHPFPLPSPALLPTSSSATASSSISATAPPSKGLLLPFAASCIPSSFYVSRNNSAPEPFTYHYYYTGRLPMKSSSTYVVGKPSSSSANVAVLP